MALQGLLRSSSRRVSLWLITFSMLISCSSRPDIQGEWFFDYEQSKLSEFPNIYYESARALIADVEPRYGNIRIEGDTIVLGGAVCKILRINDREGLSCNERNQIKTYGFYYQNERLTVQSNDSPDVKLIFTRSQQDPYKLYDIDPNKTIFDHDETKSDKLSIPTAESNINGLQGIARTASFDAFYDPKSIVNDGRLINVVMLLNYLEPLNQIGSTAPALSSVQFLTFDCPASNYRLNRYVMHEQTNGTGMVLSDSGEITPAPDWKPVPENSVNKALYMRVCY